MMIKKYRNLALVSIFFLEGCSVGPDFKSPALPAPDYYSYQGKSDRLHSGSQTIDKQTVFSSEWWKNFHSIALNEVMNKAFAQNHDVGAMRENMLAAHQMAIAAVGQLFPQVTMDADVGRQKYGVALFGPATINIPPYSYYELGPSANWNVDLFGGTRRTIEKENALAAYQDATYQSTLLSLANQVSIYALNIAYINAEINITHQLIANDEKSLRYLQKAYQLGAVGEAAVLSAKNQLASDRAQLPLLQQQRTIACDAMTVLVGESTGNWQPPQFEWQMFQLPRKLPFILPSALVRHRPDIMAAEATLHAASAEIGIATANLYPAINLSGTLTQEALSPGQLFQGASSAFGLLAGVAAPVFNGGTLRAEKNAAVHRYKAAYENYQQVVIRSFSQVNDAIHALRNDDMNVRDEKSAMESAEQTYGLMQKSYALGSVGILKVLSAAQDYRQMQLQFVTAQAKQYRDTVRFYTVLGK